MTKKALIVSALAGFIGTFLTHDIETLQSMGYEVHCAGNASNKNRKPLGVEPGQIMILDIVELSPRKNHKTAILMR